MNNTKKVTILLLSLILAVTFATIASAQYDPWEGYGSEEAAWTFFGLGLTVCIIMLIIPLILAILVGIWMYKDAEKRGKQGALWLILLILMTLFLNIIGFIIILVIWLVVRPPIGGAPVQQVQQPQQPAPGRACPNCGRAIPTDARTCPYCAKKFEES